MSLHFELSTQIDIDAEPSRVWRILTDFERYPEWNPFIRSLAGRTAVGAHLRARIQPSGGKAMNFRPRVLVFESDRELRWLGSLFVPGLFDGEHRFVLEPLSGGWTAFEHAERFRGLLVPFLRSSLDGDTRRGFEEMNVALKVRAESRG